MKEDFFKIDKEDRDLIKAYKWFKSHGYAIAHHYIHGKRTTLYMHRLIMNSPVGYEIDHINGNRADNRRKNLRVVTKQQNHFNTHKVVSSTGFKGVTLKRNGYYGSIYKNGESIHLGVFKTKEDAAIAYNYAAIKIFGEYAKLNQI